MENNLILEGLLSMVTELKEKQEQQITPASREETMKRFDAIEQCLLELRCTGRCYLSGQSTYRAELCYRLYGEDDTAVS